MGLIANIYRSGRFNPAGSFLPDDCTLNGWSSRHERVTVVNAAGPFEPTADNPAVLLVQHRTMKNHLFAVSLEHFNSGVWTMMGGNFLHSSDSRFGEAVCNILGVRNHGVYSGAIAIHDRVE